MFVSDDEVEALRTEVEKAKKIWKERSGRMNYKYEDMRRRASGFNTRRSWRGFSRTVWGCRCSPNMRRRWSGFVMGRSWGDSVGPYGDADVPPVGETAAVSADGCPCG